MTLRRLRSRKLVWTERSIRDLDAIERYIAHDDEAAAQHWIDKLLDAAKRAAKVPLAARRVPEIGRDDVREARVRTYRIVYRSHERTLVSDEIDEIQAQIYSETAKKYSALMR